MLDFLKLRPEAFGLDFSDLSLKIVKLEKQRDDLSLASFGETIINPGIIKDGEIRNKDLLVQSIKKALTEVKGKKIKTKYVVASLPEEKAFLEVIKMPKMAEEDLKSAVFYEAENYIPLPIDQVYLDSQIVYPLANHLDHYDVLINAFPKKIVDAYTLCLEEAGLKPTVLEIESAAAARALIKDELATSPVLIIDFGASKTTFIIYSGRALRYTFSISDSSLKFTEIIARELKIDFAKADALKMEYGLEMNGNKEAATVFQILLAYLSDFVEQIKKHTDYYSSHIDQDHLPPGGREIKKILLCGEGANLKGLTNFLERRLGIPVEYGNPWINVFPGGKKKIPKLLFEKSLKYTTVLGLALRGVKNYD